MHVQTSPAESQRKLTSIDIAVFVGGIAFLVGAMTWFVTYDWPSGQRPGIGEFVLFWFRELLVLMLVLFAFCVYVVRKFRGSAVTGHSDGPAV